MLSRVYSALASRVRPADGLAVLVLLGDVSGIWRGWLLGAMPWLLWINATLGWLLPLLILGVGLHRTWRAPRAVLRWATLRTLVTWLAIGVCLRMEVLLMLAALPPLIRVWTYSTMTALSALVLGGLVLSGMLWGRRRPPRKEP